MPLKAYLPEWLQLIKPTLKTKTYDSYESLLRVHLVPRLGHIKLNKLTPEQINGAWAKMLKEGHSPALIGHCHLRLSKALHDAMKRKLIANDPMRFVTKPKIETKEIRPLSSEKDDTGLSEIDRVLEVAKDTEYYAIIHTALHTGMRRNELLGLRWKDINTDESILHLNRSIHRKSGVTTYHPPKTKSGSRPIDLTPSSSLVLRKQWELQKGDALIYDYKVTEESPVFIRRTGEPLLPDTITHAFKKLVMSIGILDVWFHDLRHTHATVMLLQGVHPKVVQERLGHSKMSTTMDLYSHVMPSMQKDAVERFQMALETRV
jgi:integrase